MPIRCEIVSQDRMVFEGEVDIVVAPGADGEMGVLPRHSPLLTTLKPGVLKIRRGGSEEIFAVSGGFMEVRPDIVTILADAAEHAEEIDVARAEEARQRAEESLRSGVPRASEAYLAAEMALRRSNLRLEVARRRRAPRMETPGSSG
ncbi:MAG TPA: F0F1 ATP synthase subunit epsilon [Anaerolineales bacterium]|nr:F0F1 ATP synthase subunit epsilon [Anaerolineales bacterium]